MNSTIHHSNSISTETESSKNVDTLGIQIIIMILAFPNQNKVDPKRTKTVSIIRYGYIEHVELMQDVIRYGYIEHVELTQDVSQTFVHGNRTNEIRQIRSRNASRKK